MRSKSGGWGWNVCHLSQSVPLLLLLLMECWFYLPYLIRICTNACCSLRCCWSQANFWTCATLWVLSYLSMFVDLLPSMDNRFLHNWCFMCFQRSSSELDGWDGWDTGQYSWRCVYCVSNLGFLLSFQIVFTLVNTFHTWISMLFYTLHRYAAISGPISLDDSALLTVCCDINLY